MPLETIWNGAAWRDDRPVVAPVLRQRSVPAPALSVSAYILQCLSDGKPRTVLDLKRGTPWTANAFYVHTKRLLQTGQIQVSGYQHGAGGRLLTVAHRL